MNARTNQFQGTFERDVVVIHAEVAIGASGAATLTRGKGIKSVAKTGTGEYTFTFGVPDNRTHNYQRLLHFSGFQGGTTTAGAGEQFKVAGSPTDVQNGTFVIETVDPVDLDTPQEPESGRILFCRFELSNTSALA